MHRIFILLLMLVISRHSHAIENDGIGDNHATLISLVNQLPKTKLRNMAPLIEQISQTKKPQTRDILQFMLDGELYFFKANKQVVRAQVATNKLYQLTDVLTQQSLPEVKKSRISKIKTNNNELISLQETSSKSGTKSSKFMVLKY